MARQLRLLVTALLVVAPFAGRAEDPEKGKGPGGGERKGGKRQAGPLSAEFEDVRKAIDALTPEQRKRFQENFLRWSNLPVEQKKSLRDREELRRKRMAEEIEMAVRESGLDLEQDRRQQFAKRYVAERRKIEEQLRAETDEKRKPLVKDLIARLKEEFSSSEDRPVATPATP